MYIFYIYTYIQSLLVIYMYIYLITDKKKIFYVGALLPIYSTPPFKIHSTALS